MWVIWVTLDYEPNHRETLRRYKWRVIFAGKPYMIRGDTEQRSTLGDSAAKSNFLPFDMLLSYLNTFKNGIPIAYMIYSMIL